MRGKADFYRGDEEIGTSGDRNIGSSERQKPPQIYGKPGHVWADGILGTLSTAEDTESAEKIWVIR